MGAGWGISQMCVGGSVMLIWQPTVLDLGTSSSVNISTGNSLVVDGARNIHERPAPVVARRLVVC